MKFNSQICTTVEQSRKLLELGLRPETADVTGCCLDTSLRVSSCLAEVREQILGIIESQPDFFIWPENVSQDESIPAWSLGRLLEILSSASMPLGAGWRLSAGGCGWSGTGMYCRADSGNVYDHVIGLMEWLIRMDCFCGDYLVVNR